jgi:hypothetical protein
MAGAPSNCLNDKSIFFINTICLQDTDSVNTKRLKAHFIVSICIFISLLFLIFIYFVKQRLKITAYEWDLTMITAGDYTVCKTITDDDFNSFKATREATDHETILYQYMNFLKSYYEDHVSLEPHLNDSNDEIKIATISFAFDNGEVIKSLVKRGNAIVNKNTEKKEEAEAEIELFKKDKLDEITKPVKAYITFETQEGYERGCRMKQNGSKDLKPAVEPTNIIWENL